MELDAEVFVAGAFILFIAMALYFGVVNKLTGALVAPLWAFWWD